jgi:hypothetical protein
LGVEQGKMANIRIWALAVSLSCVVGCDSEIPSEKPPKSVNSESPKKPNNESIEEMNRPARKSIIATPAPKSVTAIHPPDSVSKPTIPALAGPISNQVFFSTKDAAMFPSSLTPLPKAEPSGTPKIVRGSLPPAPAVLQISHVKPVVAPDSNLVQVLNMGLVFKASSSVVVLQDAISSIGGQVVPIPSQTTGYEQYVLVVNRKQFAELQERLAHIGTVQVKPKQQTTLEDAKSWLSQSEEANLAALERLRDELEGNKAGESEPAKEARVEIEKMHSVVDALHRVKFASGSTIVKLMVQSIPN